MRIRFRIALAALAALASVFAVGTPALAGTSRNSDTVWITAGNGTILCTAILIVRDSDGYVMGRFQSVDLGSGTQKCAGWLERKVTGSGGYDWTPVSDTYVVNAYTKSTGWHWNGTNAGSRVCLENLTTWEMACSTGVW
ncbi:hypothetical protein [Hamadaea tsunoensis]|uniref:hypothetical protein n=1 Tax=Hamadaea tsunoensis TaxID=53368 RepID=UPI00041B31A7|nr:hypothetical protein [Hamadaea tsunoensis]